MSKRSNKISDSIVVTIGHHDESQALANWVDHG